MISELFVYETYFGQIEAAWTRSQLERRYGPGPVAEALKSGFLRECAPPCLHRRSAENEATDPYLILTPQARYAGLIGHCA